MPKYDNIIHGIRIGLTLLPAYMHLKIVLRAVYPESDEKEIMRYVRAVEHVRENT